MAEIGLQGIGVLEESWSLGILAEHVPTLEGLPLRLCHILLPRGEPIRLAPIRVRQMMVDHLLIQLNPVSNASQHMPPRAGLISDYS